MVRGTAAKAHLQTTVLSASTAYEEDRMDEHPTVGFRFVVREIITGPRELAEAVPAQAVTLACLAGADGDSEVWCAQLEQPVKHRIDPTGAPDRYHADYLDRDDDGPFVWTYYIAVQTHNAVTFGPGAHSVVVDLAYVVDPSLGYETVFDSSKVDWVATVTVDGGEAEVLPEPVPPPREPEPSAPKPRPEPAAPAPVEQLAADGPQITPEQFSQALDGALATLGTLTGTLPLDIPRPREVKARKHSPNRYRGECPSYSFQSNEVLYHTVDPLRGPAWESTTDPGEALYWMVDDVARSVAWTWARRTPAARTMNDDQVQWLLAAPMWLTLITALDPSWAGKTRARISALKKHAQETRRPRPM
jgi:hypothetical protein